MPQKTLLLLTGLYVFVWGGMNATAQQFRAEVVHLKPGNVAPSRMYVSGDKVRFEATSALKSSVVVVDLKQKTAFMAMPEDKMYTVLPPGKLPGVMPLFHPEDPDNACAAWEQSVNKPGTCTKVGDETINGRAAVKYQGTAQNGDTGVAWVDRKLRFVVKWEGKSGASELRNIQEGPQLASLFELPKNYERMNTRPPKKAAAKGGAGGSRPTSPPPHN